MGRSRKRARQECPISYVTEACWQEPKEVAEAPAVVSSPKDFLSCPSSVRGSELPCQDTEPADLPKDQVSQQSSDSMRFMDLDSIHGASLN